MTILTRHQVIIPSFTGLDRDAMTNTFHFLVLDDDFASAVPLIVAGLEGFYEAAYNPIAASNVAANSYVWNSAQVKSFDLSTPTPRIPTVTALGATIGAGASLLPAEVALCLSYNGAFVPGVPSARKRGRIFLGGLREQTMDSGSAALWPQFKTTFITQVAAAAENLMTTYSSPFNEQWTQVSRVGGGGLTAASPVVGGYVDNQPDTQRRRGGDSTNRVLWP
jgi:hypothetical protein